MAWRLILGTVWIAILTLFLGVDAYYGGPAAIVTLLLALTVIALACRELIGLLACRAPGLSPTSVYFGCLLVVASNWLGNWLQRALPATADEGPLFGPMLALAVAVVVCFVGQAVRFRQPGEAIVSLAAEVFAVVYLGGLFSFAALLRLVGAQRLPETPLLPLVALLVCTKGGDAVAYAVGRNFGRTPLAPVLSPRKTVEGALGTLLGSLLGAVLVLRQLPPFWSAPPLPWPFILAFGFAVGISAQVGDLAESLLKRDAQKKDSAPWMPGLGGVLDLLDSFLLSAPVAYLLWALYW